MIFSGYFDRSRSADPEVTVVGGYLATVKRWEQFDADWRLLLAKNNLPYFHMKKFIACQGPFRRGWRIEGRRARFLADLVEITRSYVLQSFSCAVRDSDFEAVFSSPFRGYDLNSPVGVPFTYCARHCASKMNKWIKEKGNDGHPIGYFFEDGDEGKGELDRIFERDGLPKPRFMPKLPSEHSPCQVVTPLQAADLLAWEHQKVYRLAERLELDGFRKSLEALSSIGHDWSFATKDNLMGFCDRFLNDFLESRGLAARV